MLGDLTKKLIEGIKIMHVDSLTSAYKILTMSNVGPRLIVSNLIKQIKRANPKVKIDCEAFTFMGKLVEDMLKLPKTIFLLLKKVFINN